LTLQTASLQSTHSWAGLSSLKRRSVSKLTKRRKVGRFLCKAIFRSLDRYVFVAGELRMASKKSSTNSASSSPKNAGKPKEANGTRARSASNAASTNATPSKADLDLRDRLKAGPRRPAGPPLVGDIMTQSAMDALRNQVVPAATEPKKSRGGK
jgi:hypothetical protein